MPRHSISVNGVQRTVEAPDDMPVLWVLRDLLALTGTKYGCGIGQCGACTILADGAPVRSCLVAVAEVASQSLLTIEGLEPSELPRVQSAWIDEQVPQCGYCQSGQLLTAAALLRRVPQPSDEQIDEAMSPVLCRCGTYGRIRRAIRRAAGAPNR